MAPVRGTRPKVGRRPVVPQRVLDTRTGNGGPAKAFGPGEVRDVQVVPANQGYKAVAINLTGVGPSATTYITAYPADQATAPNASNLNLLPGQTRPNLVMVGVSPDGKIRLLNAFGHVHLLVDVVGAFKGQGLWRFKNTTGWLRLTTADPA